MRCGKIFGGYVYNLLKAEMIAIYNDIMNIDGHSYNVLHLKGSRVEAWP